MKPRFPPFIGSENLVYVSTVTSEHSTDEANLANDHTDISAAFFRNDGPPNTVSINFVFPASVAVDTFAICAHTFGPGLTWRAGLSSLAQGALNIYESPDIPFGDYYAGPSANPDRRNDAFHVITTINDGAVEPSPLTAIRANISITNSSGPVDGDIGLAWICAATSLGGSSLSATKPAASVDLQGDRPVHTWNGGVASSDFSSPRNMTCAFETMSAQDANEMHRALELCGTSHPLLFIPKPWLAQQRDADDAGGIVRFVKPFQIKPLGPQKDSDSPWPDRYVSGPIEFTRWR